MTRRAVSPLAIEARHAARRHFSAAVDFRAMGETEAAAAHWRHAKRETLVAMTAEGR